MELIEIIDEVGGIMVKLTQSLKKYLENYHSDIIMVSVKLIEVIEIIDEVGGIDENRFM